MKKKQKKPVESGVIEITPKKDHIIKQNSFYYELKKGVTTSVDTRFEQVLKTESVI